MHPHHPLDAVAHRDPYPYYASLRAGAPLIYDKALNVWIAARASVVAQVFDHRGCRVRPLTEPIPQALLGSPAAEVFGRLVRMNDGAVHRQGKGVLEGVLARVPSNRIRERSRHIAGLQLPISQDAAALNAWIFRTPVSVVADLLGFSETAVGDIADLVRDFVACLSPSSTSAQLDQSGAAAITLQARLQSMLGAELAEGSLLQQIHQDAQAANWTDDAALLANLVGLLSQTYEATAGLLGNSIAALAAHPGRLAAVRGRHDGWRQLVQETSRYDPPVQNTRRFLSQPACIAGVELPAGSAILLVLAAANRDPEFNARPDEFLLDRRDRRLFSFSRGAHACPGQALATGIASAALARLFEACGEDYLGALAWSYRVSGNGRLPVFTAAKPI